MRILFVGCVKSSKILLEEILKNEYEVCGVITMREAKENSDFCSLDVIAKKYSIDCYFTQNINDKRTVEYIKFKEPDIIYCFGWSRLIKEDVLGIPSNGVVGFHPAALPNNRGRHPLIWALALGLKETASTFFIMDSGADTGRIISQEKIIIAYEDNARSLYNKVLEAAKKQVINFTQAFENKTVVSVQQNIGGGNTWRKRRCIDGQIDWRMSTNAIYNLIRALTYPYAGAHFIINGAYIKVWRAIEERDLENKWSNIEPGKVLKVNSDSDFVIKAYDGAVHIIDCEPVKLTEGEYLY